MISRLGVFGGMFDPVHRGHVQAALYGLDLMALDLLKIVPCHIPNHRPGAFASGRQRQQMLALATAEQSAIEVDTLELDREGVSYMVDTLKEIACRYENASLVLIIGTDSFNSLPQWERYSEMSELCHLLVLSRPGAFIDNNSKSLIDQHWSEKDDPERVFASQRGNYYVATDFVFDISSTKVREAILQGESLASLVDEKVVNYINGQRLYKHEKN